jgi:hypothetical protein
LTRSRFARRASARDLAKLALDVRLRMLTTETRLTATA